MADISPTCSIIVAIAIGAITRMAVTSNFANCIGGRPIQFAVLTEEKFRMAEPSGLVIPIAFMISATTYEITNPHQYRDNFKHTIFPRCLKMIITARATSARNQLVEALLIAEPARLSPIQMMTGPVTTGGRNLIITLLRPPDE